MQDPNQIRNILNERINEICFLTPGSQSRNVALLTKAWHDKLIRWLKGEQNSQMPGPIDNTPLFDGDDLPTSLQFRTDFEIVEIPMYQTLVQIFTGGPAIYRKYSVPATSGASSVLIHPISFEMITHQGSKFKTCAPDWGIRDIKRFLCMNLHVNPNDYQFLSPTTKAIINEKLTIGEYVKLNGIRILLQKITSLPPPIPSRNNSSIQGVSREFYATIPRTNKAATKLPCPSITVRSGSYLATSFPKPVGMINLGNTCFFNAAMQCIVRVKPLVEYVLSPSFDMSINKSNKKGSGGEIASSFKMLLKDMTSSSKYARNPEKFRSALIRKYSLFANYGQHDSQEVVGAILDGLHEDLNQSPGVKSQKMSSDLNSLEAHRFNNQSIIVDLFYGSFVSYIKCPKCLYESRSYEPFLFLSLPVPRRATSSVTLLDCFKIFRQEEQLDANNLWKCPRCNENVRAKNSTSVYDAPPILIIHFKRFYGSGFFATKIDSDVKYPNEFPVSELNGSGSGNYHLFGAIFHSGGMNTGHYTSAAIDISSGKWYEFNDSSARDISIQEAHSPRAYVLFYQKD